MSALREFLAELIPVILPSQRLPLLPRDPILREGGIKTPESRYFMGRAIARNPSQAGELRKKHPDKRAESIVRVEARKRKRESRLKRAIRRIRLLW